MNRDIQLKFWAVAVVGAATVSSAIGQQPNVTSAPQTGGASTLAASELLNKTLQVYQNAKSYQGDWIYVLKQGETVTRMEVELRANGPKKLMFRLHAAPKTGSPDNATAPATQTASVVPELRVVLDGKHAWFENVTEKVFYKVALPKNTVSSPLMFFPQMHTVGGVERGENQKEGDRTVGVIFAKTRTGGLSRMEIDLANHHIVRIASDETAGLVRTLTTLTIQKETFDGEISDSVFAFKPGEGFKEMKAPPEAAAVFSLPGSDKPDRDK